MDLPDLPPGIFAGLNVSADLLHSAFNLNTSLEDASTDDAKFRNQLTYYLMGIACTTVCCLGTVANILSVAVLTRRAMRLVSGSVGPSVS